MHAMRGRESAAIAGGVELSGSGGDARQGTDSGGEAGCAYTHLLAAT